MQRFPGHLRHSEAASRPADTTIRRIFARRLRAHTGQTLRVFTAFDNPPVSAAPQSLDCLSEKCAPPIGKVMTRRSLDRKADHRRVSSKRARARSGRQSSEEI